MSDRFSLNHFQEIYTESRLSIRKKGVVSPEKDMIICHILLGGNDPFFAFGQSGLVNNN